MSVGHFSIARISVLQMILPSSALRLVPLAFNPMTIPLFEIGLPFSSSPVIHLNDSLFGLALMPSSLLKSSAFFINVPTVSGLPLFVSSIEPK